MKQYETSTATLREILSHPSLQHDKVEETMDAMAEASAQQREIDEMIRQGGDMAIAEAGIDDTELEDELAKMVEEVKKEEEEKERVEKEKIAKENADREAAERKRKEEALAAIPSPPNMSTGEDGQDRDRAQALSSSNTEVVEERTQVPTESAQPPHEKGLLSQPL